MIDCHSTKELMYRRKFAKMDLSVLENILEQYLWEQNNELAWHGLAVECLETVIEVKKARLNNESSCLK